MTGLHYPDNLYADHEERKARRVANQAPTGAYRAAPEMPESERKLRTALAYVNHARDLIREALGDNEPKAQREAKIAYDLACDGRGDKNTFTDDLMDYGVAFVRHALEDGKLSVEHVPAKNVLLHPERTPKWHPDWPDSPPNCDGLSARDIRSPHPMASEVIRDHDERLQGPEDAL